MKEHVIVAVDDEGVNTSLLKAILAEYTVFPAKDITELNSVLETIIPDLILLDIMMPETDGLTIARRLKDDPAYCNIPIIFISAVTSGDSVADGLTSGADDYIKKPFDSAELTARVKRVLENSTRQHELYRRATRDGLTGLFNREYFFEQLGMSIRKWKRGCPLFSLGILDIDFFKNVNDTYGHLAGDRVLKNFSLFLFKTLRESDIIARYGGEEFIFLLNDASRDESKAVIERLRCGLAGTEIEKENHIFISFSCGICDISEIPPVDDPAAELIETADSRLYIAKKNGRNMIVAG